MGVSSYFLRKRRCLSPAGTQGAAVPREFRNVLMSGPPHDNHWKSDDELTPHPGTGITVRGSHRQHDCTAAVHNRRQPRPVFGRRTPTTWERRNARSFLRRAASERKPCDDWHRRRPGHAFRSRR